MKLRGSFGMRDWRVDRRGMVDERLAGLLDGG